MTARGTTKHACVGQRVQIPAWSDTWMRGARFGTVVRVITRPQADIFVIRMDHPQIRRCLRFRANDCNFV